jgi:hypothetical protein
MQAVAIASLHFKAAKLRSYGRDDIEHLRQAAILTSQSCFRLPGDTSPRHHILHPEPPSVEVVRASTADFVVGKADGSDA